MLPRPKEFIDENVYQLTYLIQINRNRHELIKPCLSNYEE
jgi:hypothetical protein